MKYDMVFEGGGAKGIVFVGAMQAFEEAGHTCGRLVGSSAGAITAALLAAGYDAASMKTLMEEKVDDVPIFQTFMGAPQELTTQEVHASGIFDFFKSVDIPLTPEFVENMLDNRIAKALSNHPYGPHLFALVDKGGAFVADGFHSWMERLLSTGTVNGKQRNYSDMTLKQFHDETEQDLTVTASDVTGGRLLILNHRTAPQLPLIWAVRMSMNLPFVWDEVIWQSNWGTYRGDVLTDHAIVDGGVLSNFPIELLVSGERQVTQVMGPKTDAAVMGLLIDDAEPVPIPRGVGEGIVNTLTSLKTAKRLNNLIYTMTSARDRIVIRAFRDLVVRLPAGGYGTTEFGMSDEKRDILVAAGRQAMERYLRTNSGGISSGGAGTRGPAQAPAPDGTGSQAHQEAREEADEMALSLLSR